MPRRLLFKRDLRATCDPISRGSRRCTLVRVDNQPMRGERSLKLLPLMLASFGLGGRLVLRREIPRHGPSGAYRGGRGRRDAAGPAFGLPVPPWLSRDWARE